MWKSHCRAWTFWPYKGWCTQTPSAATAAALQALLSMLCLIVLIGVLYLPGPFHAINQVCLLGADSRGVVLLGDSAGAHFHIPPEWMTVTQMSAVRNCTQFVKTAACFLRSATDRGVWFWNTCLGLFSLIIGIYEIGWGTRACRLWGTNTSAEVWGSHRGLQ